MSTGPGRRIPLPALAAGAVTAGSLLGVGASSVGAAAIFARKVLTPDRRRPDDEVVVGVGRDEVLLARTEQSVVPGRFGLWLDGGAGHARIAEVLDIDAGLVRRRVEAVDAGVLEAGPVRWNTYYYWAPPEVSLGVATEHVTFESAVGRLGAWVVLPEGGAGETWAVLVHGRGARREETIRAIPTLRTLGITALVPHYRNDDGAPAGPGGRYTLGVGEWHDIEAAIRYAAGRGAERIVLVGWSMGGAIVLQLLARSELAGLVERVVLDAPVISWADVLSHHARLNHVPAPIGSLGQAMMSRAWSRRLVGVEDVIDLASTDWVRRAQELTHPVLLIHSDDDEFVPAGPSRALAAARPDLVELVTWQDALHCQEWNTDPARWEAVVRTFIGVG